MMISRLLCCLLLVCVAYAETFTGEATYYGGDGTGACMFPAANVYFAALNAPDWDNSNHCGRCALINFEGKSVTVQIRNKCPECAHGDLDLAPSAFQQLADLSRGRIKVEWSFVECDFDSNIVVHSKDGSDQWWTALQTRKSNVGIKSIELLNSDATDYVAGSRCEWNYFIFTDGIRVPATVRVTSIEGEVGTVNLTSYHESTDYPTDFQFGVNGHSTTETSPAATAATPLMVIFVLAAVLSALLL
eukprot:GCRY01001966.1.p1 GENE.GCRY01001966.1~~GCRY01001966.1.p1  ORF type:complete len:246 (+),score=29.12 GCRY01001966.1:136-873(+)